MKSYLILILLLSLTAISFTKADTNHFGAGGLFELDLGDSEIPLTPKQEREQKLLKEKLEMKTNETKQTK
ncbi:hypothetical protein [Prochlorococcus marinus]|uniref:hypothetical protein n=1 Tax=Prochlorococcus marinus TaxID=1219 RepID=UPI0022B3B588|nr:hypothetical protein [Prochlorococcus marinus]